MKNQQDNHEDPTSSQHQNQKSVLSPTQKKEDSNSRSALQDKLLSHQQAKIEQLRSQKQLLQRKYQHASVNSGTPIVINCPCSSAMHNNESSTAVQGLREYSKLKSPNSQYTSSVIIILRPQLSTK